MNEGNEYRPIEGTFSAAEAQLLLGTIVKSKIDFHTLQRHSDGERSREDSSAVNRLKQLRSLDSQLKSLFKDEAASGQNFNISATLEITPID